MSPKIGFFLVSMLVACSSDIVLPSAVMVGTSGGSVATSDGSKVMIPSGALSTDTVITMAPTENAAVPDSATTVGATYLFGPEGTTFTKPVSVTLAFAPDKLPAGMSPTDIVIYTAAANSTNFAPLETVPVDATHVSALSNHFSVFVPVITAKSTCPVSCKLNSGSCECTATCKSKHYSLLCYEAEGCSCTTDGTQTKGVSTVDHCTNSAALKKAYTTDCGYPGQFP